MEAASESALSSERIRQFKVAYEKNVGKGRPPYAGVWIRTKQEILWILQQRHWESTVIADGGRPDFREVNLRDIIAVGISLPYADFRGATLVGGDFRKACLIGANFLGAHLNRVNMSSAQLSGAKFHSSQLEGAELSLASVEGAQFTSAFMRSICLQGACLAGAKLANADLSEADMDSACVFGSNLTGAIMVGANCRGTNFERCNFSATDLRDVQMDLSTRMSNACVNQETRFMGIDWGGVSLGQVNWVNVSRIGDESAIKGRATRKERAQKLQDVSRTYRELSILLKAQGLNKPASRFRLREQRLEAQSQYIERKFVRWIGSSSLDLISAYGENPFRAILAYFFVVISFAAIYFFYGANLHIPFSIRDAIVFSLTSFHGRGLTPQGISFKSPLILIASVEGAIGLYLEIVIIATLSRRFLRE